MRNSKGRIKENTIVWTFKTHSDPYPPAKRLSLSYFFKPSYIAKLSQGKPQLQLSWLALASLNFT